MPKPACVACKRFYRPKKNGVRVNEQMPLIDGALPSTEHENLWGPYKIWHADLWQCEGCGHELVVGYGNRPEAIRHEQHFLLALALVNVTVNDC